MTEKELGRVLKVQYTPTLLFLDEKGGVALRLNGYVPPDKFRVALDYAAQKMEGKVSYAEYLAKRSGAAATDALGSQPFFRKGADLARMLEAGKPLAVLFEQKGCKECRELHREGFSRPEVRRLVDRFTVVQLDLAGPRALVAPDGAPTNERAWAAELRITYAPSLVFFDTGGREIFRSEGYLRPFHLSSVLEYVAGGAYHDEPSFQRYVQKRADAMRAAGKPVDLWK
jgi:thioredoxin-related protein